MWHLFVSGCKKHFWDAQIVLLRVILSWFTFGYHDSDVFDQPDVDWAWVTDTQIYLLSDP